MDDKMNQHRRSYAAVVATRPSVMYKFEVQRAIKLQSLGDEPNNPDKTDKPFGKPMDNADAATDADSVTANLKSLGSETDVDTDKIYTSDVNVEHNQHERDTDLIHIKLGLMTDNEKPQEGDMELISHFDIDDDAESVKRKHLTEVENRLSNVSSEFTTVRDTHLKEIADFNKEMTVFEKRIKEDYHKLEEKAKTLNDKMTKLHKDRGDLDNTIIDNTTRWASVMHADERKQTKAKLSEQNRLLDIIKDERNFRNDRWKEFMKEVQRAKEKEVKELNDKLNEADRLIRHLISEHVDEITKSEQILTSEMAVLEKEKEVLAKELHRLQNSGDLANNSLLRNRVEYLNAEVQKRDEYILIQEERLRKTREAAALFNDLNARDYEKYRQFYRNWHEVDRQLNERSAGIKQTFQQGDGRSLVDTLTWVQTTIGRIPGNCIHANEFQRITGIIQNAIRGDYSGIRTNIWFQQEPNCVIQ